MQMESFIIIDDVEIFWLCFDMILVENRGRLGNHFLLIQGVKVKNNRNISVEENRELVEEE